MHMHKSRVNAMYSVGLDAFLVKITFFDPSDPIVIPDPTIFCVWVVVKVLVTLTKFGRNQEKGSMLKRRVARKIRKRVGWKYH